ncbi:MAG: tRNA (cytidine/uridine-2-O-)-methyltransferase [Bradyrhizobium sp.]|nr:tRNA (cytidine/uridine-2-O-)-methyltransferase [Bradyrhizobium sp.]
MLHSCCSCWRRKKASSITRATTNGQRLKKGCRSSVVILDECIDRLVRIALYQPDIPQNTGTILRLCACLNVEAHIIEPAGFPVSDRHFRRAGMDYLDQVRIVRHDSWTKFEQWRHSERLRLVLFSTRGALPYLDYRYTTSDILLFGRESAGVPDEVIAAADARLVIPIAPGLRSLNVAMASAMALGEALRQTASGDNGISRQ